MKTLIKKYFIITLTASMVLSACSVADVNDIEPLYQLSEDEAITSVDKAQTVLIGTYGVVKNGNIITYLPGITALMGGTMEPGTSGGASEASYRDNNVSPDDSFIDQIYTTLYKVINNANHIITKAPLIETTDPRRNEIVGEARFLRALSHFYLLRLFGQFYDKTSEYGVVIMDKPVTGAIAKARSTVAECYTFILADLNYAVANAPSFSKTFYASRQAAQGLRAKVNLYAGDYSNAALDAKAVIAGPWKLEDKFYDVFTKKTVNTKEVLFQTPFDDKNDRNNKAYQMRAGGLYKLSVEYANVILKGDSRDTSVVLRNPNNVIWNRKFSYPIFNGQSLTADTEYFLRLPEIYLIMAEAIVRSNGDYQLARDAVNVVRGRVNMPFITTNDKALLLEAIRKEKLLELGAESGEEWYDYLRYNKEGNLAIATYRPGTANANRYVLPLPLKTVQLSNNVIKQNPGY